MIVGMNHFTVTAEDEAKTLDFYCGLLGLHVGHRPDLGFPGAWLYGTGTQAVLHMYFGRPVPTQRTGVIDHMAFTAEGLRGQSALRSARLEIRTGATGRLRHLAAFLPRPERGKGRTGLRCKGIFSGLLRRRTNPM